MSQLKIDLARNLSNIPGWITSRKIVVIESDDWGSVRMPTLEALRRLRDAGLDLETADSRRYNHNDTLASPQDLNQLFELLTEFKDSKGSHPAFTAVSLVANPDYERILDSKFQQYYFETFDKTLEKYGYPESFQLWKEGIKSKLFVPQFHAREHLNVPVWMKALQKGDSEALLAFNEGLWGYNNKHPYGCYYQATFDVEEVSDIEIQKETIESGLVLFEQLFGYKASYFVPPNGPINNSLEETAAKNGIKFMSASKIQREALGQGKTKKHFHYLGQTNKWGQKYITRNCFFEPGIQGKDWVNSCLGEINTAFRWKKPAVISTHRVNFIGVHHQENRENGLNQLRKLLAGIVQKWPDVEFMTSNELGELL